MFDVPNLILYASNHVEYSPNFDNLCWQFVTK